MEFLKVAGWFFLGCAAGYLLACVGFAGMLYQSGMTVHRWRIVPDIELVLWQAIRRIREEQS